MRKEVIGIFLVVLLVIMPFSSAQLNSIEIKDVNVNENSIQVLIQNNLDKNFNKITFIINNQYTIIQDESLNALETKFFYVNYPGGIKLETLMIIVGDQSDDYVFIGNEGTFVINQEASQTSELAQIESNSPISYIYSAGRVAKIQDNNIVYFSSDNVGSTSLETDSSGGISFKANYLPFGKELSFSSIGKEKYGFTSKEYDAESSLNYFNARYYNPSNGKFISNDPIFKPSEGGYAYVNNNPLTITDPSGKSGCSGSQSDMCSMATSQYATESRALPIPVNNPYIPPPIIYTLPKIASGLSIGAMMAGLGAGAVLLFWPSDTGEPTEQDYQNWRKDRGLPLPPYGPKDYEYIRLSTPKSSPNPEPAKSIDEERSDREEGWCTVVTCLEVYHSISEQGIIFGPGNTRGEGVLRNKNLFMSRREADIWIRSFFSTRREIPYAIVGVTENVLKTAVPNPTIPGVLRVPELRIALANKKLALIPRIIGFSERDTDIALPYRMQIFQKYLQGEHYDAENY